MHTFIQPMPYQIVIFKTQLKAIELVNSASSSTKSVDAKTIKIWPLEFNYVGIVASGIACVYLQVLLKITQRLLFIKP